MGKPLPIDEVRRRAGEFVRTWADSPGDERQDAQSFVQSLLQVYGVSDLRAANYEKRAKRSSTGKQGYIDALIPGRAVIEMKSKGKHLATAEAQALDYLEDLTDAEQPRYVITSDFHYFRILDKLTPSGEPDTIEFDLSEFPANAHRMSFLGNENAAPATAAEQEAASVKAARLMGSLYEELEKTGFPDEDASVFLVRTLFCLYADDAGIWEPDLFTLYLLNRTSDDGIDLGPMMIRLFQWLSNPPERRQSNVAELLAMFPYVNGDVFSRRIDTPELTRTFRQRLLACADFNWSQISPAVFGSLFQSVKDKKARRELGEHYTTERHILRLINPMFMDDLRQKYENAKSDSAKLRALRNEIKKMRFLDPACGCGNFLLVCYRELRKFDLEILKQLQTIGSKLRKGESLQLFVSDDDINNLPVNLSHFHGIELEEFPAEIARTALHIADHQANLEMMDALGEAPPSIPLTKVETITVANALRTDWASVVPPSDHLYIFGNPPFIGQYTKGADQTADLKLVWGNRYDGYLDYVSGWWAKSLDLFKRTDYDGEFAFVSTNSITQGQPVPALFGAVFDAGWKLKFAHRTFAWTSEAPGAAAVHCVITGYEHANKRSKVRVWDYPNLKGDGVESEAKNLNGYLIDGPNLLVEKTMKPLSPLLPPAVRGSQPTDDGNLIVEAADYDEVAADPIAAKYLRPFRMGRELINDLPRWCLWLENLEPADLNRSNILKTRVDAVREFRLKSTKAATREKANTPQLFDERRQPTVPYLAIPAVFSETRRWTTCDHYEPRVIAGNKVYTCDDPDGFAFAIISSSAFIGWQKAVGGRLKSDPNFSNTLTWNTFPLPAMSDAQKQAIISGGGAILDARNEIAAKAEAAGLPKPSLAELYNPLAMKPELLAAHKQLDKAVDAVFKLGNPTDAQRLAALFKSYQEMTTANQLNLPKTKPTRKAKQ